MLHVWDDPDWVADELECLRDRGGPVCLARLLHMALLEARAAEVADPSAPFLL
jgi:hypothetical protein